MLKIISLGITILTLGMVYHQINIMTTSSVHSQTEDSMLEKSIHQKVNQYRQSKNLPPLTYDSRISEQARKHSQNMAKEIVPFSHQGFETRIKNIAINYRSVGENVAYNQGHQKPDLVAVEGWIKSLGHEKNMVGNFNLTGVGVAKNSQGEYYFTQIFILTK